MKFTNGWTSPNKQWDKWEIRLRCGAIDVLRIKYDHSDKYFEIRILNLGVKGGGKKKVGKRK